MVYTIPLLWVWATRHVFQILYPVVNKIKEVLLFVKALLKSSGCTGHQLQHFSLLPSPHPCPQYWTGWIGNFFQLRAPFLSSVQLFASPQIPIRLFCGIFQARILEWAAIPSSFQLRSRWNLWHVFTAPVVPTYVSSDVRVTISSW